MSADGIVERLAGLDSFAGVPRAEFEWLVRHGEIVVFEPGAVVLHRGDPIHWMYVIVSGQLPIYRDLGGGPRLLQQSGPGDVSGALPYSRGSASPSEVVAVERLEALAVHRRLFPEVIRNCPAFTTRVVHIMLDRSRVFEAMGLQEERALSLGKLAAGLAHEINNPSSATVRAAKLLESGLVDADAAVRVLCGAALTSDELDAVEQLRDACLKRGDGTLRSPMQQARREDEMAAWLERHGAAGGHAAPLAETALEMCALDELAARLSGERLDAALGWVATRCAIHALAGDIARATTQIHELVGAVKRFTHMDRLSGPEFVDVVPGLRDTLQVITSKTRAKSAVIVLDVEPALPKVSAVASDLNQIWLNLIDNALDAIGPAGRVDISARRELNRVLVRVIDDGAGIPAEVLPRIFDPFFTTKPPGQGTGLGLEITRQLLRRNEGAVSVQSRPGRTEFLVSLRAQAAT